MEIRESNAIPVRCGCGQEIASSLLECPGCNRLVHADRLRHLVGEAEKETASSRWTEAMMIWRDALVLLPPASKQFQVITGKIQQLQKQAVLSGKGTPAPSSRWKKLGWFIPIGLILWKFKTLLILAFTKLKFVLFGFSKLSTVFSMFLSFGLYWTLWGWKFAAGLVFGIYVHEMGHVWALRQLGIRASAPMFIPGLGAFIRARQEFSDPVENANVGLAGPIWGLGISLIYCGIGWVTGFDLWFVLGKVNAWINLFNLVPFGSLDGGRAFTALNRRYRILVVAAMLAAFLMSHEGLLILLMLVGTATIFGKNQLEKDNPKILVRFCLLLAILTWLARLAVQLPGEEERSMKEKENAAVRMRPEKSHDQ